MFQERVAIGTKNKGNIQNLSVFEGLLHASPYRVIVVFRFYDCNREIGFIGEEIINFLSLSPPDRLATDNNATFGEIDFFSHLLHYIPLGAAWAYDRGRDEFRANIGFGQFLLVHAPRP